MTSLEELERQFILEEDMEHEDINNLISRMLKFCKIDKKGYVIIYNKKLIIRDKILLVLSARYLANKLQEKLGKEITIMASINAKELAKMLREKENAIRARFKDLKEEGKIVTLKRGVYKITPHSIEDFLKILEDEESYKNG